MLKKEHFSFNQDAENHLMIYLLQAAPTSKEKAEEEEEEEDEEEEESDDDEDEVRNMDS